jgi:NAD(P)-dependent dehydrogenase (short-subunit alcohol dehydrogenase family)
VGGDAGGVGTGIVGGRGPLPSAAMSVISLVPGDTMIDPSLFPEGMTDVHGQQIDLRTKNSWLLSLPEVSSPELAEVMAVNTIAPFIFNGRLKPMFLRAIEMQQQQLRPNERGVKGAAYVINVSAMEGKFYRHKSPHHPHTNMAKAALNMLTRTSAEDYAKKRIYMNSVDTGWINDENPIHAAAKTAKTNNFQTPLDEVDAAMRILDPIFLGEQGTETERRWPFGKFFKDYRETDW